MPEGVRRQFVQVGRKYYFPDGARAFTDRGRRLTTPSENTEVIRSLIVIAKARGWSDVTVTGTERFRKEAWFAARLSGIDVRGYKPTEFEQERLVRAAARLSGADAGKGAPPGQSESPLDDSADVSDKGSGRRDRDGRVGLTAGRLIDHGRATYRHDPHEPMSYFVKIETERGERTLWGVDLERAFKESLTRPQVGDEIGLRAVRQDAVTVKAQERDADGHVVGEKNLDTHRNRWIVEKRDFFEARAAAAHTVRDSKVQAREAVKQYPELAGTYLYLRGAAEIAQRRIRDPEDQRKFVATVRRALAESVARGEPLPPVRLRERKSPHRPASRSARPSEREQAPARG
jgi:putative DNA primase/helicase